MAWLHQSSTELTSSVQLQHPDPFPAGRISTGGTGHPGGEDWHQLRLHALEALVGDLTAARRYGDATTAAGAAIRADPLRESAQAALIRVHLAEGNQSEALRAFDRFSHLLQADLGLAPTPQLHELVADLLQASHHRAGPGLSSEHAHPAHRPFDHPGAL
jgi:DNA-binding SARP family transcriptional activator